MKNKHNKKIGIIIFAAIVWMVFVFSMNMYSSSNVIADTVSDTSSALAERMHKKLSAYTSPHNEYLFGEGGSHGTMMSTEKNCAPFACYTGVEFIELYNTFEKNTGNSFLNKYIYNDTDIDAYIRNLAERRGYQKRTYVQGQDLVEMDGLSIQKQVADSYVRLRDEMLEQDLSLFIASGYRSSTKQRSLFLEKVGDINTSEILSGIHHDRLEYALERSALPGYSKHHSGFAVDFACGKDYVVFGFGFTECYDWLSKNNFEQAKRFGFIPSYPDNIPNQGPNPEPWEFVWVGVENIK